MHSHAKSNQQSSRDACHSAARTRRSHGHPVRHCNLAGNRLTQTDPPTADAATQPGGHFSEVWTSDAAGNELTHTDRRGIVTATTYDSENRPLTVTRDNLTTSTRTYDTDGHVETETDALGRLTTTVYDEAGRHIQEDLPLQAKRSWTYEPIGDVHTATDADGRTTTSTYTPRRFLASEANNANETTTYTSDGEGHRITMQRPLGDGYTWTYAYDEGDRLASVTDPNTSITTYAYDVDGNRIGQTDANTPAHTTTFAYDARHRHTTTTAPTVTAGTAVASWTYDADGNVATQHTPNGRTLTFTTDALNRTINASVDLPSAQEIATTAWHHDGNGNVIAEDETLGDANVRHATRHYDAFDRLDHAIDVHGKSIDVGYDAVGNRKSLADADQQTTSWAFDALNHNTSVTVTGQGTTTIESTPAGLVHLVTRPGQSTTTTDYDATGRIERITHAAAGSEIAHEAYGYDANGNRTEQKEANGAVTANVEQTTTYTYDPADRLTDVQTPERATHYELDAVGNRKVEQIKNAQGTSISSSTLTYNERDELTRRDDAVTHLHVDLGYDADGNQITQTDASGTRSFVYDAHDRLQTLTQPAQQPLTFDYQSDGLRIAKHQGANETRYQYDQQSLLAETNAIGNTLASYHYSATQLISRTEAGSTPSQRHYLLDALNTPIALLTQEGAISARTKYDAWGEISAQQGTGGAVTTPNTDGANAELPNTDQQTVGYTGYVKDQESGLYYAKARYYDPRIARFTTQDPEAGQAMQPPSLHRYLYAYANPTIYVDSTGRCVEPVTFIICAAVLGAEIGFATDFLSQEHESLQNGRSDSLGSFVSNDYDAKRGAINTAISAATGPIAPGLGQVGVRASIAVAASVTVGAGLQTGIEGATTTDPNFDPKTAFLRNEAIGAGLAFGGAIGAKAIGQALGFVSSRTPAIGGSTKQAIVTESQSSLTPESVPESVGNVPAIAKLAPTTQSDVLTGDPLQIAADTRNRLARDVAVSPIAPPVRPIQGRAVGTSTWQATELQRDLAEAQAMQAQDIRVDQHQVNAGGQRVGVNRPDLQYTRPDGSRVYIEYDRNTRQTFPNTPRGPGHSERILSNDPEGVVILRTSSR